MPKEALLRLSVSTVSMMRPGTMNAPYDTPSMLTMREPMAEPNTTKYSEVVITGAAMLWKMVRKVRDISKV